MVFREIQPRGMGGGLPYNKGRSAHQKLLRGTKILFLYGRGLKFFFTP